MGLGPISLDGLPLYGCLAGFTLPVERYELAAGVGLERTFIDTFGTQMMAFAPPPEKGAPHPAPWAAVRTGFNFQGRIQVGLTDLSAFPGVRASNLLWMIAALSRLRIKAPVRVALVSNVPFQQLREIPNAGHATPFESALPHIGLFDGLQAQASSEDIEWLRISLPKLIALYENERFARAFSIFDESTWSPRPELAMILLWTSLEILCDLGASRQKTKDLSDKLSDWLASTREEKSLAYNLVQQMYGKRGSVVHAARRIKFADYAQSQMMARAAFTNAINWSKLP